MHGDADRSCFLVDNETDEKDGVPMLPTRCLGLVAETVRDGQANTSTTAVKVNRTDCTNVMVSIKKRGLSLCVKTQKRAFVVLKRYIVVLLCSRKPCHVLRIKHTL